jgi:uncharacterized protein
MENIKSKSELSSEEIRVLDSICTNESELNHKWYHNIKYVVIGLFFGIIFIKAEIISWFRIQEMFRFKSFHMYGVIGSAVIVGMISIFLLKKLKVKTIYGEKIQFVTKEFNQGQIYGGILFGLGWALTGACPGPLFAQIGTGITVTIVTLLSAIFGTWVYGYFRDKIPH